MVALTGRDWVAMSSKGGATKPGEWIRNLQSSCHPAGAGLPHALQLRGSHGSGAFHPNCR